MFINGQWLSAENNKGFSVYNPANGQVIGAVPDGGEIIGLGFSMQYYELFCVIIAIISFFFNLLLAVPQGIPSCLDFF